MEKYNVFYLSPPIDIYVPPMSHCLVITTCPDQDTAVKLAESLVENRLAACVSCLPGVRSFYEWKGKLEKSQEQLLLIKTRSDKYQELEQALCSIHPYELPEIIAVPIAEGFRPYLDWIDTQLDNNQ